MLIVMCGLPGVGKSAMAEAVGRALRAPVLSVDPVEAAMWRAGIDRGQPTGLAAYVVVEALAREVLKLGQTVVVDAVNDVAEARWQWERLGAIFVEVICSDQVVHRERLERRKRDIEGFDEPAWRDVQERRKNFEAWEGDRFVVDSMNGVDHNLELVLNHLGSGPASRAQYE